MGTDPEQKNRDLDKAGSVFRGYSKPESGWNPEQATTPEIATSPSQNFVSKAGSSQKQNFSPQTGRSTVSPQDIPSKQTATTPAKKVSLRTVICTIVIIISLFGLAGTVALAKINRNNATTAPDNTTTAPPGDDTPESTAPPGDANSTDKPDGGDTGLHGNAGNNSRNPDAGVMPIDDNEDAGTTAPNNNSPGGATNPETPTAPAEPSENAPGDDTIADNNTNIPGGDADTPDAENIPDDNASAPDGDAKALPDDASVFDKAHGTTSRTASLTTGYIIAIAVFALTFSAGLCTLLVAWRWPNFHHECSPVLNIVLGTILLTLLLSVGTVLLTEQLLTSSEPAALSSAETAAESGETTLDAGVIVESAQIDLSAYDTNITIARAGTYTLSGSFAHSVIVDAEGAEVELILDGVTISAPEAAAIVGLSATQLTISLADGTESILTDAGNSEYDGCVFSYAELVFTGNGTLTVNGEQEEGEGIATKNAGITFEGGTYLITSADDGINTGGDGGMITINGGEFYINAGGDGIDSNSGAEINGGTVFVIGSDTGGDSGIDTETGYTINGGTVVALGSDMLEKPASDSAQSFLALSLSEAVATGEAVGLTDANSLALIAFSAPKSFRTVIISTAELSASGQYQLKTGGSFRGGVAESNGFTVAGTNSYSGGTAVTVGGESFFSPE